MKIIKNPLFWIFLLALFLRLYKLEEFPVGVHVDEMKVGWNALSILITGFDDHLKKFSLYYNSFGDYRPTGIFYFTIPAIALFGKSIFAIRFPVALLGALSVFPIYLLTNLLIKKGKEINLNINAGHLAALILAISPWHIELSRATNEVVISTFFAILSLYFFIKLIQTSKNHYVYLSVTSIVASYLTYHAIRFLAPPFFIATAILNLKTYQKSSKKILLSTPVVIVCLLTFFFSTTKEGVARFNQTSIFKNVDTLYELQRIRSEDASAGVFVRLFDNKAVIFLKRFVSEYSQYFAGDFLIGDSARPYRFSTPGMGLISYIEAILLVFGLIEITKNNRSKLPLFLLLIAPLPAAMTSEDAPNMSRAFLMLPFIVMIESFGFLLLTDIFKKYKSKIILIILMLLFANFSYFTWMYIHHSISHRPYLKDFFVDSPTYRDVGTLELAGKLSDLQKKYDRIVITNFPDSPYPWYAFFAGKDPFYFNQTYKITTNERDFENIIFSESKCPTDYAFQKYKDKKLLVIDAWECDYTSQIGAGLSAKVVGKINRQDGTEVYALLEHVAISAPTKVQR